MKKIVDKKKVGRKKTRAFTTTELAIVVSVYLLIILVSIPSLYILFNKKNIVISNGNNSINTNLGVSESNSNDVALINAAQTVLDNEACNKRVPGDGLYFINGFYRYVGGNPNNYIKVGVTTYRILKIDPNNSTVYGLTIVATGGDLNKDDWVMAYLESGGDTYSYGTNWIGVWNGTDYTKTTWGSGSIVFSNTSGSNSISIIANNFTTVRKVTNLGSSITITSGEGTASNPYIAS